MNRPVASPPAARRRPHPVLLLASVLLGALVLASSASARPGQLDPSFGDGGIAPEAIGFGTGVIEDAAVMPGGKILVTGSTGDGLVARFGAGGFLDTSFGVGGRLSPLGLVDCPEGCRRTFNAAMPLSGNTALVSGFAETAGFVVKVGAADWWDGTPYFGSATTNGVQYEGVSRTVRLQAGSARPDGTAVVTGYATEDLHGRPRHTAVAFGLDRSGRVDSKWGNVPHHGFVLRYPRPTSRRLVSTFNGAQLMEDGTSFLVGTAKVNGGRRMMVLKLGRRGKPLAGFGATRPGFSFLGRGTAGEDVVSDPETGAVYAVGRKADRRGRQHLFVAKLDSGGRLVRSFGRRGLFVARQAGSSATAVALDEDRLVVGGGRTLKRNRKALWVARLLFDGSLDRGFGRKGVFSTRLDGASYANSVAIDGRGRVVVGGRTATPLGPQPLLMRLTGR